MSAANMDDMKAYHQFIQQAVQHGFAVDQATPDKFEQFKAEQQQAQRNSSELSVQEFMEKTGVDRQLEIAERIMEKRHDVLRKLAE